MSVGQLDILRKRGCKEKKKLKKPIKTGQLTKGRRIMSARATDWQCLLSYLISTYQSTIVGFHSIIWRTDLAFTCVKKLPIRGLFPSVACDYELISLLYEIKHLYRLNWLNTNLISRTCLIFRFSLLMYKTFSSFNFQGRNSIGGAFVF